MTTQTARNIFWSTVALTSVIKIWLAGWFPITGDEAFFHEWANHLNYGYYDHPPMIGWWLWALTLISHDPIVIRSLTMLLTTVVAFGIVWLGKELSEPGDEPKAWLAGAVYLSLPVSWFAVFVTTDTPLIFFMSASVATYVVAVRRDSAKGVFLAGVFLGLAFLSKYFAVLLGFALGAHILTQRRRFTFAFALLAGVLPLAAVNVVYNMFNCWNNIMFNLVNRHDDAQLGWQTVAGYVAMLVYMVTPWAAWGMIKGSKAYRGQSALLFVVLVPLCLFLLISLEKRVGLHWVMGFLPAMFVLLGLGVSERFMSRAVWANAILSVPHVLLFAVLMHAPAGSIESMMEKIGVRREKAVDFKQDVQFHRQMPEVLAALKDGLPADGLLATTAYSPAALMSFHNKEIVPVFGAGKYHARNDDVFVDWREHRGKTIRIASKAKPLKVEDYARFFDAVRLYQLEVADIPYWVVEGLHFKYEEFRDVYLREAVEKYYRIPPVLPVLDCPFGRKYGFEKECRIGDLGIFGR